MISDIYAPMLEKNNIERELEREEVAERAQK